MTFATIDSLRESLAGPPRKVRSPEYALKMMHELPDAVTIDRAQFIISRAKDKAVLDIGASGALHEALKAAAKRVYAIDKPAHGGTSMCVDRADFDLDDVTQAGLPAFPWGSDDGPAVELVVAGEVVEHLSNPGHFLKRLRSAYANVPVIVTVPNAFTVAGRKHMEDGVENVNLDHVAWYSWHTLKVLVERAGYTVREFYWYNGEPGFAEGLIFVLE